MQIKMYARTSLDQLLCNFCPRLCSWAEDEGEEFHPRSLTQLSRHSALHTIASVRIRCIALYLSPYLFFILSLSISFPLFLSRAFFIYLALNLTLSLFISLLVSLYLFISFHLSLSQSFFFSLSFSIMICFLSFPFICSTLFLSFIPCQLLSLSLFFIYIYIFPSFLSLSCLMMFFILASILQIHLFASLLNSLFSLQLIFFLTQFSISLMTCRNLY